MDVNKNTIPPGIGAGRRILLVEDNEDNQAIYRLILEHLGFQVLLAATGADALRLARKEQPRLILMDISIPIIDGWEATAILKADVTTRHIPVVALTAHALPSDQTRAREVGCDGYLAKPVEPRVVVQTILDLLAPEGGAPAVGTSG